MGSWWSRLGGRLGIAFALAGFVLIFLGWNGAASWDRLPSQFPYLISGGVAGGCLVVLGVGLMVIESQRRDRSLLEQRLTELQEAVTRLAASAGADAGRSATGPHQLVVAGPTSFHRPDCRLLEGREELASMAVEDAEGAGLHPCRVCDPTSTKPRRTARRSGGRARTRS